MYKFVIATLVVAGMFGFVAINGLDFSTVYKAETIEKIIDKTPDWVKDCDAECEAAAKGVIRQQEIDARLEVLNLEIKEREDEKVILEKESGAY